MPEDHDDRDDRSPSRRDLERFVSKEIEHKVRNIEQTILGIDAKTREFVSRGEIVHLIEKAERATDQRSAQRWRYYTGHTIGANPYEPIESDTRLSRRLSVLVDDDAPKRVKYVGDRIEEDERGVKREERVRAWLTIAGGLGASSVLSYLIGHFVK